MKRWYRSSDPRRGRASGTVRLLAMLAVLAVLVAACGADDVAVEDEDEAAASQAEDIGGVLRYYSWEGYDLLDQTEEWREEHGVDMRSGYIGGHDDIHTRVLSPGGEDIDLITYYHGYGDNYRELDVVSPISEEEIPNLEHVMPFFRDSEWFRNEDGTYSGIPFTWGAICLNYRTDTVDNPPERWTDLLEPEYEGRIAMVDDLNGNVVLASLILGYDPEALTLEELEDVKGVLLDFKDQAVTIAPSFGDVNNLLVAGEADAAFMGWSALNVWAAEQDVDLECIVPEEGSLTFVDAYAIPPGAENRETALAFINETLSSDVQIEQAEYLSAGTVREDVVDQLPEDVRGLYPYDDLDPYFEQAPMFGMPPLEREDDVHASFEDWTRMWQEVKAE